MTKFRKVTKVFLGAHTVLSNGALFSRAGTALVAMAAHAKHIPVIVLCESYKFSDRVQLDSFVYNELAPTKELDLDRIEVDKAFGKTNGEKYFDYRKLNLMYDVTPSKFVDLCISEIGLLPTSAVPGTKAYVL